LSAINDKLKSIPGVELAVVITKEGKLIEDSSFEAEYLGAHGQFLANFNTQLGSLLGLGDSKSSAIQGVEHHLFMSDTKSHHLCVAAKGSCQPNSVEAEIRRVLAQK